MRKTDAQERKNKRHELNGAVDEARLSAEAGTNWGNCDLSEEQRRGEVQDSVKIEGGYEDTKSLAQNRKAWRTVTCDPAKEGRNTTDRSYKRTRSTDIWNNVPEKIHFVCLDLFVKNALFSSKYITVQHHYKQTFVSTVQRYLCVYTNRVNIVMRIARSLY